MKKRILSMALAAILTLCLSPVNAFAANIVGPSTKIVYIGENYPGNRPNDAAVDFNSNGGGPNTTSVSGRIPLGMSWKDAYNNNEVFLLIGTPQPGTAGSYSVTGTCSTDNSSINCTLTVAKGPQTIHVDDGAAADVSAITVPMGASYTLNTYSKDASGNKINIATDYPTLTAADHQPTYTYSSSDTGVATVAANGVVTPVATGTTTITINSAATNSYEAAAAKTITLNVGYGITNTLTNITTDGKSVIALNTDYTATLTADTGYTLPAAITVKAGSTTLAAGTGYTYNNTTGAVSINAASITGNIEITAAADKIIDLSAIDGVTAPKAGETPVSAITECGQYTGTVTWAPAATTFGYATSYTATITLTPKPGYTLTGVAENFFTVAGATAANAANSGVITAVFPRTENAPFYGGDVTTYPVTLPSTVDGGTVSVSPKNASAGATVTITPKPNDGKQVDKVTVTDSKGNTVAVTENTDGTYSFKQPNGGATVSVSFKAKAWANPFADVKESDWFYKDVQYVYEQGLMQGTSKTTFSPSTTTTRGMIVTILWRMAGSPVVNYAMTFTDVPGDAYYAEAVRWAAANKIVGGYGNDRFGPDDSITREQLATILYRFAGYMKYDTTQGGMAIREYNDYESVSSYAAEAMAWSVSVGLLQGDNNNLMPQGNAVRAQAAAILHRFCENIAK